MFVRPDCHNETIMNRYQCGSARQTHDSAKGSKRSGRARPRHNHRLSAGIARLLSGFLVDNRPNLFEKLRHVDLNHLPQGLVLQAEVVVCHQIASACDLLPLHRWVPIADFLGNVLDGLANDLEKPHQRLVRHSLFREIRKGQTLGKVDDLPAGILDVIEKQDVVTRHGLPRARCWA